MNSLQKRIFSSIVYGAIWIAAVYDKRALLILAMVCMLQCIIEYFKIRTAPFNQFYVTGLLSAISFVYIWLKGINDTMWLPILLGITIIVQFIFIADLFNSKPSILKRLPPFIGGITYITLPLILLIPSTFRLYDIDDKLILFLILTVWINDVGAFFAGRAFGRKSFFKKHSPNKTLEGFLGGLILSTIFGIGVMHYFNLSSWTPHFALLMAAMASFGDIVESKYKRSCNAKDSGQLIPGHGGLLDRLDGFIFAIPMATLFTYLLELS